MRYVLPSELHSGNYQLEVTTGNSVFQEKNPFPGRVDDMYPSFYMLTPNRLLYALHGDFRGPVTALDPALPGEVVHIMAAGLGPVSPAAPSNMPAPAEPRSMTTAKLKWIV